ncbi:MAG TPA: DUF1292 domain-containing protein [Candidatus Faeciplasma avium]|uniref:DUF1292 domain-containing protein n=1 Tax=Candidatus Faeciplasma avium TaxID=2840798 RepID=A0A9D1T417_9FIRM|nr:DUF1292 domain-containing protein [Candidatus Faeciplasma avium]
MADRAIMTAIGESGEIIDCDVLFTFKNTALNRCYIVYTENTTDENGDTEVFASIFDPDDKTLTLHPIETEEEWALLESKLREFEIKRREEGE